MGEGGGAGEGGGRMDASLTPVCKAGLLNQPEMSSLA